MREFKALDPNELIKFDSSIAEGLDGLVDVLRYPVPESNLRGATVVASALLTGIAGTMIHAPLSAEAEVQRPVIEHYSEILPEIISADVVPVVLGDNTEQNVQPETITVQTGDSVWSIVNYLAGDRTNNRVVNAAVNKFIDKNAIAATTTPSGLVNANIKPGDVFKTEELNNQITIAAIEDFLSFMPEDLEKSEQLNRFLDSLSSDEVVDFSASEAVSIEEPAILQTPHTALAAVFPFDQDDVDTFEHFLDYLGTSEADAAINETVQESSSQRVNVLESPEKTASVTESDTVAGNVELNKWADLDHAGLIDTITSFESQGLINFNSTYPRVRQSVMESRDTGMTFTHDKDSSLKTEVNLHRRTLELALVLADQGYVVNIGSVTTGDHSKNSNHYDGLALDLGGDMQGIFDFLKTYSNELGVNELIFANNEGLKHGNPHMYDDDIRELHMGHLHASIKDEVADLPMPAFLPSDRMHPKVVEAIDKALENIDVVIAANKAIDTELAAPVFKIENIIVEGSDSATKRAHEAATIMQNNGISPMGIAVVLGVFMQESSIRNDLIGGSNERGVCQTKPDRSVGLPSDLAGQVQFCIDQMQTMRNFKEKVWAVLINPDSTWDENVEAMKIFEGYGKEGDRNKYAEIFYAQGVS